MEKKFKVGQRVEVVKGYCSAKVGMTGVIINVFDYDSPLYQVRFDKKFPGGHDCGGHCKYGYGHNLYTEHLKLIEESASTKYKPGDVVTVRSDLTNKAYYMTDGKNYMTPADQMLTKRGQKVKIKSVTKTGKYMIEGSIFPWVDEMFVDESKVEPKKTSEPRFKVGDKVRVRKGLETYKTYYMADGRHGDCIVSEMARLQGEVVTIESVYDKYRIKECDYNWTDEMFEPDVVKEEPKKTESDCEFKIGDKVVVVETNIEEDVHGKYSGTVGEIVKGPFGRDHQWCVKMFDGRNIWSNVKSCTPAFDWEAFKKGKVAVHCGSPEKLTMFLEECEKKNLKWVSGSKATNYNAWYLWGIRTHVHYNPKTGLNQSPAEYYREKYDADIMECPFGDISKAEKSVSKKWKLVIRGEGDKTTAEYIVNDVKTTAEVRRFHEDQYSVRKAVEFVTNKVLPEEKWVVGVKFDKGEKVYNYYTTDNTIKAGDKVVVPAGKDNHHVAATVVDIKPESEVWVAVLPDNMKYVDRKCTEDDVITYYNGKVVCVYATPTSIYTVGKIYNVVDGQIRLGMRSTDYVPKVPVKTFKDFEEMTHGIANFVEIVE